MRSIVCTATLCILYYVHSDASVLFIDNVSQKIDSMIDSNVPQPKCVNAGKLTILGLVYPSVLHAPTIH